MKPTVGFLVTAAAFALNGFLLTGCGDSDSDNGDVSTSASYQVVLENATANQPLSPPAIILHDQSFTGWQFGQPVSTGLEELAEGGDPAAFRNEALASGARDNQAGSAVIPPGATTSVTVTGNPDDALLTVASMLVNTNDAFTGISDADISDLEVGESRTWDLAPLDAGTEVNSEVASTLPGPAGGGEGFNPIRDDRNFVSIHPGIVSADDGLTTSDLEESHRFQNPVARLLVTRLE